MLNLQMEVHLSERSGIGVVNSTRTILRVATGVPIPYGRCGKGCGLPYLHSWVRTGSTAWQSAVWSRDHRQLLDGQSQIMTPVAALSAAARIGVTTL